MRDIAASLQPDLMECAADLNAFLMRNTPNGVLVMRRVRHSAAVFARTAPHGALGVYRATRLMKTDDT